MFFGVSWCWTSIGPEKQILKIVFSLVISSSAVCCLPCMILNLAAHTDVAFFRCFRSYSWRRAPLRSWSPPAPSSRRT
jgi:hypothetical protein